MASTSETSRRTNSLAFAKYNCHTCTKLNEQCDRRRPRCTTCLSSRRRCDGFAMPLVWKNLEVAQIPSTSSQRTASKGNYQQDLKSAGNAEFKFIRGRPKKKRKPKSDRPGIAGQSHGCFSTTQDVPSAFNEATQPGVPLFSDMMEQSLGNCAPRDCGLAFLTAT